MGTEKKAMDVSETALHSAFEVLLRQGLDGAGEALRILVDQAMVIERSAHLRASSYERSADRNGYANGFKPKTMLTRMGHLTLQVPQVRDSSFYPSALEKGSRTERAVNLALAEMYVQGVSTRRVITVLQSLLGPDIELSSSQVSRATSALDIGLAQWRARALGETPYVLLDARYEKVRTDGGPVVDCAVLVAMGVTADGKRRMLGVSVSLSEAEVHWREFLQGLQARGLCGVKLIVSDAHPGLQLARRAVLPSVPWQRCQFHLQQNAGSYVARIDQKAEIAAQLRGIFNAPSREESERQLRQAIDGWRKNNSKLADWAETNVPEGFSVFALPTAHRVRMRTTNALERVNRELKRRTRVASIFPNAASCLRLVSALLAEIDDEWLNGKIYLNITTNI